MTPRPAHPISLPLWPNRLRSSAATGALVLADGTVFLGEGLGAVGAADGEVCFNTSMTGYQEILTDPSYAAQIVAFTFPHIGNVGTNNEDIETSSPAASAAARGAVFRTRPTRAVELARDDDLDAWLKKRNVIALAGLDTRALTKRIREHGMPNARHRARARRQVRPRSTAQAREGVAGPRRPRSRERSHDRAKLRRQRRPLAAGRSACREVTKPRFTVVVMDYGVKRNILRALGDIGATHHRAARHRHAEEVMAHKPDGILLSNGPGDPAATGKYAAPQIKKMVDSGTPVMGVCLGHQMLGLALGAKTMKMAQGHHGANHPVKDKATGKVEIVSMNHGFAIDPKTLPKGVKETHVSLFDGSNCGIELEGKPVFSVQYHPEASPGPQDSHYLFERFAKRWRRKQERGLSGYR